MLEVKGELVFKTVAYHRAADAIGRSPVDLVAAYRPARRRGSPGVGAAISDKIAELATTGQHGLLRPAPGRDPARARRRCSDPGARAQDRPPAPRRPRDRVDRRPARGRRGRPAARPARACRRRPRRSCSRASPASSRRPAGCCSTRPRLDRRRTSTAALADTPGVIGLEPAGSFRAQARDDRRPRPPRRDRRRGRR